MRIWIDITAPAHVLVFRPLIDIMVERGDEVEVTSRDYGQTLQLLDMHGIDHTPIGSHAGRSRVAKATEMARRVARLRTWAAPRRFDAALTHGSHYLTMAARLLGIRSSTTFDYEFAAMQHHFGCRSASRVVVPDAIPADRLERYGVDADKLRTYGGLKEEYYLCDFEADPEVVARWWGEGPDAADAVRVVVRTPPDVSLYHRNSNHVFGRVLEHLGRRDGVNVVVLPRTVEQRLSVRQLGHPTIQVPDAAVDAQSLVASADVVVSAGGTMNREAAALGVPVYTTFGGRLGGVDEQLLRDGRLRPLADPTAIELRRRDRVVDRPTRRPELLLSRLLD